MTTLTPEMVAVLPYIEQQTSLNISDVLRQGFIKVYHEIRNTGKLSLEPLQSEEVA